jgi:PAS domain S-box-containing protein
MGILVSRGPTTWSESKISAANTYALNLTGYPSKDLLGKPISHLHRPAAFHHVETNLTWQSFSQGELPLVRRDRSTHWVNHFISTLSSADQQPHTFVTVYEPLGTDVGGQHVPPEDDRLQALFHASTDAIISINSDGVVTDMNFATTRMFGYSRDELIGSNISTLMPEPFRSQHNDYIRRYLETGIPSIIGRGRDLIAQRKNGSLFPIELLVDEVDHRGTFMGIIRDTSERKRLERQIVEIASDEQRRLGRELHDGIGQQLTGLHLYAGALAEVIEASVRSGVLREGSAESSTLREILGKLSTGIKEAARSVQALSRGVLPILKDSQSLWLSLEEMVRTVDGLHGIRCDFVHPEYFSLGEGDKINHLFRIAQEGLNNALKHSGAHSVIVSLEKLDGRAVLEVRDDGIGIDPSSLVEDGVAGAGLRILRYRADLIGAQLDISRMADGGTRLRCTFDIQGAPWA